MVQERPHAVGIAYDVDCAVRWRDGALRNRALSPPPHDPLDWRQQRMAKMRMLCPFSRQLCKDCSVYRGRHYALCFSESYRGYLGKPGEGARATPRSPFEPGSNNRIVIPVIRVKRPVDLFPVAPEAPHKEL